MPDKRALKILFDTYWNASGWRGAGLRNWVPSTPEADLRHAIAAGVMFAPRVVRHDEAVAAVIELRAAIEPERVGRAFVASLSSRDPGLRSALGTLAVALNMPLHPFKVRPEGLACVECGGYDSTDPVDLNVLSFERHKWGGVRHTDPTYMAFDLARFLVEDRSTPSPRDRTVLVATIDTIEQMPSGAKLAELVRATAGCVSGNAAERRTLVELLGFAGVLRVSGHASFLHSFPSPAARAETPWHKDDWAYPTRWWRGGDGVDREATRFWFGDLA